MPNRENIRKWVDALRSGEYEQTTGYLEYNGKYCCLGVACQIAAKDGLQVTRAVNDDTNEVQYDGLGGVLPNSVVDWLGIEVGNPVLPVPGAATFAAELNDVHGWTFEKIADAIEKKYLTEETANV